jgi:hypothetical protein
MVLARVLLRRVGAVIVGAAILVTLVMALVFRARGLDCGKPVHRADACCRGAVVEGC